MNNPITKVIDLSDFGLFTKKPVLSPDTKLVLESIDGGFVLIEKTKQLSRRELMIGKYSKLYEVNIAPFIISHDGIYNCYDLVNQLVFELNATCNIISAIEIVKNRESDIQSTIEHIITIVLIEIASENDVEDYIELGENIDLFTNKINDQLYVYGLEITRLTVIVKPDSDYIEDKKERAENLKEKDYSKYSEDCQRDDMESQFLEELRRECYGMVTYNNSRPKENKFLLACKHRLEASDRRKELSDVSQVQFSAIIPKDIEIGLKTILEIYMYEEEYHYIIDLYREKEEIKETIKGNYEVGKGTKVVIILDSPDIEIDDNQDDSIWCGKYSIFSFSVCIPNDFIKEQIDFCGKVYFDSVLVTKIKFVANTKSKVKQRIEVQKDMIKSAFVSYANLDLPKVMARIQGMEKFTEIDFFVDVRQLKSGQLWEDTLYDEILKRDILLLFWSINAAKSEWVEKEWKYALYNKGIEYIEPIPMDSPKICPPPTELASKHFNESILFYINDQE